MFPNERSVTVGKSTGVSDDVVGKRLPSILRGYSNYPKWGLIPSPRHSAYAEKRIRAYELGRGTARIRAQNGGKMSVAEAPGSVAAGIARREAREMIGKADKVEELPIPEWARLSFAPGSVPVITDPLNQYAAAKMVAYGSKRSQQKVIWPWLQRRMRRGALEEAQGRQMLYSPAGVGNRYV